MPKHPLATGLSRLVGAEVYVRFVRELDHTVHDVGHHPPTGVVGHLNAPVTSHRTAIASRHGR